MPYETVFEVTQKPFEWWWPAFGLIFVVIGVFLIKFGPKLDRNKNRKDIRLTFAISPKLLGWFFVVFASLWTLIAFGSTYSSYRELLEAYRTGRYSVVEGIVEDFHPMPYGGHQSECFRVAKERFCYSDYAVSPAFNQSASHGGPIRAGLPVRISYCEDDDFQPRILRLEISADSLPSGAERAAYAKTAEQKWQEWVKNDPTQDQLNLGFLLAALVVSLCWTIDWKHYLRYWIWSDPPHSRLVTIGFRGFFLACLVASAIELARAVSEKPRTVADFAGPAAYGLLVIGFFGVVDVIFRWRLRRRAQSAANQAHSPSS